MLEMTRDVPWVGTRMLAEPVPASDIAAWVLTVLNAHIYPSTNHRKGSKWNQHLDLGFYLIEFHEFWCLSISTGGYQEIWKKGPHVGFT